MATRRSAAPTPRALTRAASVRPWIRCVPPIRDWREPSMSSGPCTLRPRREGTHFDHLARAIVYQQLSGSAAATIYGRFMAQCGDGAGADPGRRARARCHDAARVRPLRRPRRRPSATWHAMWSTGVYPSMPSRRWRMKRSSRRSCQVRGVGRWTAQMFLMFRLGRPDVLPVLDLGVRKGRAAHLQHARPAGRRSPGKGRAELAAMGKHRQLVLLARPRSGGRRRLVAAPAFARAVANGAPMRRLLLGMTKRVFQRTVRVPVPVEALFAWHERPGAFSGCRRRGMSRACSNRSGGIRDGAKVTLQVQAGPRADHLAAARIATTSRIGSSSM